MRTLIKNASIVNEGKIYTSDVLIEKDRIQQISENIEIITKYHDSEPRLERRVTVFCLRIMDKSTRRNHVVWYV